MEIIQFITGLNDRTAANIRSKIYNRGVLSSYEPNGDRIVFYTSKNQRFNDTDKLKLDCNGFVFDVKNMKPLVIPPLTYKSNIDKNIVNKHISNGVYDIYKVEDGTVFSLYWWEPSNKWVISTTRSYEINDKKWGSLTYTEIIKYILEKLGHDDKKFYNSLDKSHSYTFGFKHPNMHPFHEGKEPIYKLWFIQSSNLETYKVNYKFPNEFGINCQVKYETKVEDISELFSQLHSSLDTYIEEGEVNYGFMLRSRNIDEPNEYSNIMLESSLLQRIRLLYYHSNFNFAAQEMQYDRESYIIVYSYLDINRHLLFRKLFPQYNSKFYKLDEITSDLTKDILNIVKNKNVELKYPNYSTIIYNALTSRYNIANDRNATKFVITYLLTDQWLNIYYDIYVTAFN